MSFLSKWDNGKEYPYFRAGAEGQYSLGPPGKPNVPNILKSLDYVKKKNSHYLDVEEKLVLMLPTKERVQYIYERLKELDQYADSKLLSQLPDTSQREYLENKINQCRESLQDTGKEKPKLKPAGQKRSVDKLLRELDEEFENEDR